MFYIVLPVPCGLLGQSSRSTATAFLVVCQVCQAYACIGGEGLLVCVYLKFTQRTEDLVACTFAVIHTVCVGGDLLEVQPSPKHNHQSNLVLSHKDVSDLLIKFEKMCVCMCQSPIQGNFSILTYVLVVLVHKICIDCTGCPPLTCRISPRPARPYLPLSTAAAARPGHRWEADSPAGQSLPGADPQDRRLPL